MPNRRLQSRSLYTRANSNIMVNRPDGFMVPGVYGPVSIGMSPPSTIETPAWWLGGTDWNSVLHRSGSILPAVTRATEVIVGTLVRTPWRYTDADDNILPRPLWVDDPMLLGRVPGPNGPTAPAGNRLDGYSFWATWLTHALWYGRGAFVAAEAADGTPLPGAMHLLNPYLVTCNDDGRWVINPADANSVTTDFDGRFQLGNKTWRLVVLRGMSPTDGSTPEGVLVRHVDTLRLGVAVSQYVAGTFASGVPAGYIKVTSAIKPEQAKQIQEDWMAAHGDRRSIAVLNSTIDFEPISISPLDAQAEQTATANAADISRAFNLDPIWMGIGASGMAYNNASDRRRDLTDISLAGWDERLTATLTSCLPYGSRVAIDWAAFTLPNIEQHMPALVAGVQTGILTALEARQFLGLERKTGPDPKWTDRSPAVTEPQPVPAIGPAPTEEVTDEPAA